MSTQQNPPNYNAIDEAIEKHPGIRAGVVFLGLVIIAVIQAVRWAMQYSPMTGL